MAKKGEVNIGGEFQLGIARVGVGEDLDAKIDQAELAAAVTVPDGFDQEADWGSGEVELGEVRLFD